MLWPVYVFVCVHVCVCVCVSVREQVGAISSSVVDTKLIFRAAVR